MPDGMDEKQFRSCSRTSDDRKIVGLTCILWMKLGPNQGEKEEEGRHERARYGLSYTYPWTIFLKHIFRRRERHQGSNFCTLPFSPPYSFMIHFVCRPQPMFFQPFAWRENRRDKRTIHALFPLFVNRSYNYRKKCVSITLLLLFFAMVVVQMLSEQKGGIDRESCQHSKSTQLYSLARDSLDKKRRSSCSWRGA